MATVSFEIYMKEKTIISLSIVLCIILFFSVFIPQTAFAQEKQAGTSATFEETQINEVRDNRVEILQKFLEQYNSPLASNAETFVKEADKNKIDWKLLPSIAGVESTFAHAEPAYC